MSVAALAAWSALGWAFGKATPRAVWTGRRAWGVAGLASLCLLGIAAWKPLVYDRLPDRRSESESAPNVVLIVVDALRSDHLSAYGYHRDTSPNIKRMADEGVRFDRAYAHGNRTAISMPALFTSMYPAFSGAFAFQKYMAPLPDDRHTIAEMLRDRGYRTVGMMSNIYLKTAYGLGQGFDRTEEFNEVRFRFSVYRLLVFLGVMHKPTYARGGSPSGTEVTDAALGWLRRLPEDGPYFLFVHYMDAHHEYRPPREHELLFRSGSAIDPIDGDALFRETKQLIANPPPIALGENERQRLVDLYDACIHYADSEIGRLIGAVEERNGRETVVLVTADHGDEFMEHGSVYHVNLVNEELLRVPLVVWQTGGGMGPRRVEGMSRHIDVLPTIAEMTGSTTPEAAVGTSLVPLMDGTADEVAHVSYAEGDFCTAVISGQWKVMYVDTTDAYALYDLARDPYGQVDVAAEHPDRVEELKALLDEYMAGAVEVKQRQGTAATAETIRQLRALGYVN
jgi:arylsulfatase A-like enzyme